MTVEGRSFCARCGTSLGPGASFCPRCGTSIPVAPGATVATAPDGAPEGHNALLDALRHAALGEYEILAELGRGGMATVYLAHDLALDRKVAIKVLAPALLLMGEGMVERFKREARTAAALSHPHIIPIYAVKESGQVLYFVMKYVQGRPLDSIIRDVGQLPIPMVQTILAHVGDALGYAHRHGVIHRDIKSANIMLDEEGWAVVTDFGIAKVVQAEGLTVTGVTVGTPSYMSPEQCATREVTGASDQYSLGIVAYEMLTGHLPFRGDSTMSVMYAHFNERPRSVTELRPDCPPNLAAAVMRMLEKDPLGRWPSMDDVVAVCGRPSLRRDDPIRSQMITLARAGVQARQLAALKTPTSPIALAKRQARPVTSEPRRRFRLWWGLGVVGVGVALWWVAPWRMFRPLTAPVPGTDMARGQVAPAAPETAAARPPPESTARVARGTRSPARRESGPRPAPGVSPNSAGAAESAARAAGARREDSLVLSLRTTAVAAMRRALEAGATPAELANGDTALRGAESLAAAGRLPEAMVQLATATALWRDAERLSRARVAQDSARLHAAEPAPPPAAVRPPADPRAQIERAIADYARALESLDVGQVRRAYPGLTPAQQQGWKDLFESVRRLRAGLTVTAVNLVGGTAEAIVSGDYEYESATTRRTERRPVTFRAVLVADSTGWRLTAIR
ncbi:MAG TPA: serine/threonine-protein kinase [Gemmatimonadales bacterium]|nr:serine/threonine-protein kinase [Gemmatimonadales bacterium]